MRGRFPVPGKISGAMYLAEEGDAAWGIWQSGCAIAGAMYLAEECAIAGAMCAIAGAMYLAEEGDAS